MVIQSTIDDYLFEPLKTEQSMTPRQHMLHNFMKTRDSDIKYKNQEVLIQTYENWIHCHCLDTKKYTYFYTEEREEKPDAPYGNLSSLRRMRNDLKAIRMDDTAQEVTICNRIANNREEALVYVKKQFRALWDKKKLLDKMLDKINKNGQTRLVFNTEKGSIEAFKKEKHND